MVLYYACRPLEIDVNASQQLELLLVWNIVLLSTIFNVSRATNATLINAINFFQTKHSVSRDNKLSIYWAFSWMFMNFVNHRKKFPYKNFTNGLLPSTIVIEPSARTKWTVRILFIWKAFKKHWPMNAPQTIFWGFVLFVFSGGRVVVFYLFYRSGLSI